MDGELPASPEELGLKPEEPEVEKDEVKYNWSDQAYTDEVVNSKDPLLKEYMKVELDYLIKGGG